jgi:hypothetical protein
MKILHGPANVGNQPWTLSRAERKLGLKSDVAVNYGTWLEYPSDKTVGKYGNKTLVEFFRRATFALAAAARYDVLHFYFGRSFMTWDDLGFQHGRSPIENAVVMSDVNIARLFRKRMFMTLQGCDARLADRSNKINRETPCAAGRCRAFDTCVSQLDDARIRMMAELLPRMSRVFCLNPELRRYVERAEFVPYANVDISTQPVVLPTGHARPRIVHAPSDQGLKGTPDILEALRSLQDVLSFELIVVENTPHQEAMKIYQSADVAIDQIHFGWYGGFAVEMMAMGKPVAAYIREEDREFVPAKMWGDLPIIRLDPSRLKEDLGSMIERAKDLPRLGRLSRHFVEQWHDPDKLARMMTRIYENPNSEMIMSGYSG